MKKRILVILAILAIPILSAFAQEVKVHAIVFCNTDDEKIGISCKNDQARFVEELGVIQAALGCDVDWLNVYTGSACSKKNLEDALSSLRCGSNDVVFFYYSGHGVHAQADPADGWLPQMCLKYESYDQDKFVPVTYVRDKLKGKGARLNIILTDCCNNNASWVTVKSLLMGVTTPPKTNGIDVVRLKKLFYDSKGMVIATSSKRGQYSYGPNEGGCFSISFWDEILKLEQGQGTATWNAVLDAAKHNTLDLTDGKQEPVFQINTETTSTQISEQPVNNNVVIISMEQDLTTAFKKLVDNSYSRSNRLSMVESIASRLFTSDASVILLGRNLTTNVGGPTPIKKYLEELALSKTVKGLNIVKSHKSALGKYDLIYVSEIR